MGCIAAWIRASSRSAAAQHRSEDIRIEHAVHGNTFGGGFEAGDLTDGVHQRLPVVRAGAAHQRSVDIEKNQIGAGFDSKIREASLE